MSNGELKNWALVLGASSGFGGAAALELARALKPEGQRLPHRFERRLVGERLLRGGHIVLAGCGGVG